MPKIFSPTIFISGKVGSRMIRVTGVPLDHRFVCALQILARSAMVRAVTVPLLLETTATSLAHAGTIAAANTSASMRRVFASNLFLLRHAAGPLPIVLEASATLNG